MDIRISEKFDAALVRKSKELYEEMPGFRSKVGIQMNNLRDNPKIGIPNPSTNKKGKIYRVKIVNTDLYIEYAVLNNENLIIFLDIL